MKRISTLILALILALCTIGGALADEKSVAITTTEGFPVVTENITLSIFGEQSALHGDWADSIMFKKYQEMTGITLDFHTVPADGFAENKALMFAGDELPDMFVRAKLSNNELMQYSDMLLPLEDLIPTYAPNFYKFMQENPAVTAAVTAADGHIYALSNIFTLEAALNEKYWLNTSWLAETGLAVPTTIDEFTDVLRAYKGKDWNGNGEADEVPFGGQNLQSIISNLCGCWGLQWQFGYMFNVDENKTVTSWATSDAFKDMVSYLNTLYTEELLDNEILTNTYAQFVAKVGNGQMGFFFNQADDIFQSDNYIGISPFSGRSEEVLAKFFCMAKNTGVFAISVDCPYPEAALRWVDYFYSQEGSIFFMMGIEGETWNYDENKIPQYTDEIINHPNGASAAIGQFTIWPGGSGSMWCNEFNGAAVAKPKTVEAAKALSNYRYPVYGAPAFTQEARERLSILEDDIRTYITTTVAKFINGDLSLDKWDSYVRTLNDMGIEEYTQLYQTALNGAD